MTTLKVQASAPEGKPTITLERELDAPPAVVFDAFSNQEALAVWWGPNGFTLTFHEMDFKVGGRTRFDMRGPNGMLFPNRIVYLSIERPDRIVYRHGADLDLDPNVFEVTVTFAALPEGRTLLTMRSLFASVWARDAVLGFGAVELGKQTVEKLAAYLEERATA